MKNLQKKITYVFDCWIRYKGKKYIDTRHNVGFKVIDKIVTQYYLKNIKKILTVIHLKVNT